MDVSDILLRLVMGALIGFSIGLTGVGGGILGLLSMTLIFHLDPILAVGTTSLYIFLTNISASFQHAKLGHIAWASAGRLLLGAIPADIFVSRWISAQTNDELFKYHLRIFIVCVVFLSVITMIINALKTPSSETENSKETFAQRMQKQWFPRNVVSVLLGVVVGALIGASSIGGGILIVPLLLIVFGLSASATVGTSIFMAMLLTLTTAIVYGKGGSVEIHTALVMAVGSLLGVRQGTQLSKKLPDRILRFVIIGIVLFAATMMLIDLLEHPRTL